MTPVELVLSKLENPRKDKDGWRARCPAHNGSSTTTLTVAEGDDGRVLVHCFGGCSPDAIVKAICLSLDDLRAPSSGPVKRHDKPPKKPKQIFPNAASAIAGYERLLQQTCAAQWEYHNAEGDLVGVIARWNRPDGSKEIRPVSRNGQGWYQGALPGHRPLYCLPGLKSCTRIYVVEGEKAADAARSVGLVATTSMQGCGSPHLSYWTPLAGREVVILPDQDGPGRKYARDVTSILQSLNPPATVRIVTLPDLPSKGDAFDFVACRRGEGLEDEAIRAEIESLADEADEELKQSKADSGREKKSQADQVVALAEKHYLIGQSTTGEPFAVARDGPNLALMFSGSKSPLKSALSRMFRGAHQKVPTASSLGDAMCALAGEAHDAKPQVVALRLATHGNGIIIDLGDSEGRAVQVTPGGWQVIDRSPVLFQRTALSAAMPIPIRQAGGLDRLRDLLNVSDDDWSLLVGYLVSTFFPDIGHPVLLVGGQQGTGKSTASRLIEETIDPSTCPLRSEPKNLESWTLAAAGSWAVCLDNLSEIRDWLSDAICRAATGDGLVKRKLYTGGELDVFSFRRCVILNSIDAGAMRGDLGERLLMVELQPIQPENRRTDAEINALFNEHRPAILGGLLDLVVEVLCVLPDVKVRAMGRMADFDRILAAVDQVRGTDAREVYLRSTAQIAEAVVESDPISLAIKAFFENPNAVVRLEGNPAKLMSEVQPDPEPKDWPKNARAFGGRLRRLIPALAGVGIIVVPPLPTDGSRTFSLYRKVVEPDRTTAQNLAGDSEDAENSHAVATAPDRIAPPSTAPELRIAPAPDENRDNPPRERWVV